jgi:hypothetical protein
MPEEPTDEMPRLSGSYVPLIFKYIASANALFKALSKNQHDTEN